MRISRHNPATQTTISDCAAFTDFHTILGHLPCPVYLTRSFTICLNKRLKRPTLVHMDSSPYKIHR